MLYMQSLVKDSKYTALGQLQQAPGCSAKERSVACRILSDWCNGGSNIC
jgi:hypothetical protein